MAPTFHGRLGLPPFRYLAKPGEPPMATTPPPRVACASMRLSARLKTLWSAEARAGTRTTSASRVRGIGTRLLHVVHVVHAHLHLGGVELDEGEEAEEA